MKQFNYQKAANISMGICLALGLSLSMFAGA